MWVCFDASTKTAPAAVETGTRNTCCCWPPLSVELVGITIDWLIGDIFKDGKGVVGKVMTAWCCGCCCCCWCCGWKFWTVTGRMWRTSWPCAVVARRVLPSAVFTKTACAGAPDDVTKRGCDVIKEVFGRSWDVLNTWLDCCSWTGMITFCCCCCGCPTVGGNGSKLVKVCCSLIAELLPAVSPTVVFDDFSMAVRQISSDRSMLTLPVGSLFLLMSAVLGNSRFCKLNRILDYYLYRINHFLIGQS